MATTDGYTLSLKSFAAGLKPEQILWVDEWSSKHAYIPRENGSEAGKYNLNRTPYARDVLRALSPQHPAKRVVVMGASQLLKTQVFLNWLMANIDAQPANFLALMPSGNLATRLSNRISNTIKTTARVVDKVAKPRSRDARNTLDTKEFDGGTLYITTAGSAKNLAEIPARYVYGDEVDRWETSVEGEGDPIKLVEARTSTYGKKAKIYYSSSPTIEGQSKIKELYDRGTRHVYEVPCPHCGEYHTLMQENMKWTAAALTVKKAWFVCQECGGEIHEQHKTAMLKSGRYVQTNFDEWDGETWSYHISALNAPLGWVSWADLAGEYLQAQELVKKNDFEALQVYTNTRLALTYNAGASATTSDKLKLRAEDYRLRLVSAKALVLTCAVDVQGDRLEAMIVGWGRDGECWVVDYHVVAGSPVDHDTWKALDKYISTPVLHVNGGEVKIQATLIDTGGNATQDVYNYVRGKKRFNVLAIKGASTRGKPVIATRPALVDLRVNGKVDKKGVELWSIGSDTAKQYLWERWHLTDGAGAMHFSKDLSDSFFKGLTSELRTVVYRKGKAVVDWQPVKGVRNEPLDLSVYNLAAAYYLGLHKYSESDWAGKEFDAYPVSEKTKNETDWTKLGEDYVTIDASSYWKTQ